MKIKLFICLVLLFGSCKCQSEEKLFPNYLPLNDLKDFSGNRQSKHFFLNIDEEISFKHGEKYYYKADLSGFGIFYLAKVDNVIYSLTGDINGIYNENKFISIGEKKQILGNPFDGYKCFLDRKKDSAYYYICVEEMFGHSTEKSPLEIRTIVISQDRGFEQFIFRDRVTEDYFVAKHNQ